MSVAPLFRDRHAGGVALAEALAAYARGPQVVVLGMARGGVAVAAPVAPVAHALDGPLDTFIARKLVVPGLEEVAFGAIAEGAARPCSTMSMTTSGFRGASRHPGWRTNAPRSSGASSGIGMAGRCAGWRGARSSWSTTESPAARRSGPPRARFVDTGRPTHRSGSGRVERWVREVAADFDAVLALRRRRSSGRSPTGTTTTTGG
jgi:hypothetical protein